MFDLRPVGYVIGLLVATLGLFMLVPLGLDLWQGNGNGPAFFEAFIITVLSGGLISMACANSVGSDLGLRQIFLITVLVWLALPLFGALPFMLGELDPERGALGFTDAFFEAMSGLTTTGATVVADVEIIPDGLKLWRGILQWLGGIGIVVVAMVFLPELRLGGMQIFRSEAFDTMGKIMPRAGEIASRISVIYIALTGAALISYSAAGMGFLDALTHAMTTVSTGGLGNYNTSFARFPPVVEYIAVVFMILAALPFVRYVQLLAGSAQPLWRDRQIRVFFGIVTVLVLVLTAHLWLRQDALTETAFRKALFNVTSIITGTGYSSDDYMTWGSFAVVMFFFIGLIGGCAGSTSCSIKVFRYQLFFASLKAQVRRIHSPHGVFTPRFEGRAVSEDVLNSVMAFFVFFIVTLGVVAVALGFTGLDFTTSVSGAAAALGNIGPGLGTEIGPAGNYAELVPVAKWILAVAMFVGRLEVIAVYALFTWTFWRQ